MLDLIGLDFETYGGVDLPRYGLANYVGDKTFTPLIGSVALPSKYNQIRPVKITFDFTRDRVASRRDLKDTIGARHICAHNSGFEHAVLDHLNITYPEDRFIDSAVVARAVGGGGRLEAAAPQLLGFDKIEAGKALMKIFSMPGPFQEAAGNLMFDRGVIDKHPDEWLQYCEYCEVDAEASLMLVENFLSQITEQELEYMAVTQAMNRQGWNVDIPRAEEMQRRYLDNMAAALEQFRTVNDAPDLNLNSLPQMKKWTADRGVKCTSFDEKHVARYLAAVSKKLDEHTANKIKLKPVQLHGYQEVEDLLRTKQTLGGSSLKKLVPLLETSHESRLYDQYLHVGAGQSWRTTGRSVQMQNLKRLDAEHLRDMESLDDLDSVWSNDDLALSIRQLFTASHPLGFLIVGDFKSVENVGLAWLAGETWKTDAFKRGLDMYKVLAEKIYSVSYDAVTKTQRQTGKVGELSCGYQAGGGAVQSFAEGMGVTLTEAEAASIVHDWRLANPAIVNFWALLDEMLREVMAKRTVQLHYLPDGLVLKIRPSFTPASLDKQHPGAQSLEMSVTDSTGKHILRRYFHGCHMRGRDIAYYKPSDRKTGDLWRNHFVDPKTKQVRFYTIYGGKLAGILTQSFCRELFMEALLKVHHWCKATAQFDLVGQFHDEIVVDWQPGLLSLEMTKTVLDSYMSSPGFAPSFPLKADIKHDYRYTK